MPYIVHPSAEEAGCDAWFALPAGFLVLPLDALLTATGPGAAERLRDAVAPLLATAPDDRVRQQFVARIAAAQHTLALLCEEGTVHCALGLHRDDDGDDGPLMSLFTFTWRQIARAPRSLVAARTIAGRGHDAAELVDLPCGPGALGEMCRTVPAAHGLAEERLLLLTAYIPHPSGERLAVLDLATAAVARAEHYRAMLRDTAYGFTFDDPHVNEAHRAKR
jgi:hypothetical protein